VVSTKLKILGLDQIDPSPFRDLKRFPLNEENVSDLVSKMTSSGVLPATGGISVRVKGDRYELAFGHHRTEALRRMGHTKIEVLVADIDDEHMVKYLASENKALKNSGFVAQYESWLATEEYLSATSRGRPEPLTVAKFLGWTTTRVKTGKEYVEANALAKTCNNFSTLVAEMVMDEISCISWTNATAEKMVVAQMATRNETLRRSDRQNLSKEETALELARVAEAGRLTVEQINKGDVTPAKAKESLSKNLHDVTMHHKDLKDLGKINRIKEKEADRRKYGPSFDTAVATMCVGLNKMLSDDTFAPRLNDFVDAIDTLHTEGKYGEIIKIVDALEGVARRAQRYADVLAQRPKSNLIAIEGGK